MARHGDSAERRKGLSTDADYPADEWQPDVEPSWLGEPLGDPLTRSVPSFDLGPHTESVVVDLSDTEPIQTGGAAYPSPVSESLEPTPAPAPEPPPSPSPTPSPTPAPSPATSSAPTPATSSAPSPSRARHAAPHFEVPPSPGAEHGAETLTAATVLRSRRARPQSGWRKRVLTMTAGRVNFGLSPADRYRADLLARARTPVRGTHRVAVISLKGGVGKTTTTAALGSMFANLRGDRVIAVDANPDRGTLAERVPRESGATIRHLLQSRDQVKRYGDVRLFTSQSPTRLEVLASDSDPSASSALSEQDYVDTIDTLERFYNLVLTDCGTGLLHDAMRGVLGLASSLIVVSSASLDGARSASATLDWLEAHGLDDLARAAVVVISSVRPGGGIVDVLQLEDHFASRCRAVVTIPYDPHLEAGGVLDLDELDEETVEAYRELAAAVGEGFAAPATR
ncbi:MAG: MinD/ParA family protein [Sporichthyaceae bacterium]|nr:MinD/ParA family protein [Sporichthyaceae bacterium]